MNLLIEGSNKQKCIDLHNYLITNYPDAPGSSGNHQYFKGGYYKHIEDIINYANKLYQSFSFPFSLSDVHLILFLHDIEKPVKYCDVTNESDEEIRLRLISKFNIELNENQISALKYIHGEGNDYRKDMRVMSPLSAFCHCCDVMSARIFFD